ncbi:MAG TPA: alkaline phosphatase family protein [Gemmatimonadales bacterium]|nr:alkaline phosphatase family protein [Gemmatimonadales bacterium]
MVKRRTNAATGQGGHGPRRWPWILGGTLLLVVVAGGVWLAATGTPPGQLLELVGRGGDTKLREPMRPARGGPRAIILAFDGVGADELHEALASGGMPSLAAVLGRPTGERGEYAHGYAVPGVLSILPSTTIAAWTSVFTGEPPGRTGVPGNEWFERRTGRFHAPAPVSVDGNEHALAVYSDSLMSALVRVPTLYDQVQLRSYVSLSQVHHGADLLVLPSAKSFGDLMTAAIRGASDETVERELYAELDRGATRSLVKNLEEHGIPDVLTVYFPGVDLYTHLAPDPLASERAYLTEVLDSAVAAVLDAYRAAGALDDTWIVMVADHGHTPTLNDDRHALGTDGDDEPPAVLARAGFRLRPFVLEPDSADADFQATVAYQGAFAFIYLADRSTCLEPGLRCMWERPPRLEEDVLPVVRAFDAANRRGEGVPELQGTLDLILVRTPSADDVTAPLSVWDGRRLVPLHRWLARHPRPDLLDLERRLEGLTLGPYGDHAGDILLLARTGSERPIEERFYFSHEYRSWHGSPTRQDSEIPLVVARADMRGADVRALVHRLVGERPDQLDIAPLVRALLAPNESLGLR